MTPLNLHYTTFREFQDLNQRRCEEAFHSREDPWPVQNWALAIAGEAGELCNYVKKVLRGDFTWEEARQNILKEAADVITYCDLLISALGADTGEEVLNKFDEVSARIGWQE